ncbi:MAG: Asp-tRNA(Asn)/Glu-tRNA(Gln) amidotransferase subunit GatA [Flavobacteriales bacterium]
MNAIPTSIRSVQEAVSSGSLTMKQLLEHYIANIREKDPELNLFVELFEKEAHQRAEEVQERMEKGTHGELAGLVIAIKDNICIKDHEVTAASNILGDFTSIYDATVIQRLREADAIILGRTNCDEFAMGSSNENSRYGPSRNPIDPERVPGGSSGASAAVVKADMCLAALGSDTGGSVRQPASFCDVVGLKPSYGRVSRYGLIAYASSFDQIGPLTKNVEDAGRILSVIGGGDPSDSTCSDREVPELRKIERPENPLRLAYFTDVLEADGIDPEVKSGFEEFLERKEREGHEVNGSEFGYMDQLVPAYQVLSNAEASSNLARYDGIHFGMRSEGVEGSEASYLRSRTEGFGPEVKRRIMLGTFVLSAGYYDAYFGKAQQVRRLIRERTLELLSEHDLIAIPTTPTPPFRLGEKIDDPVTMYLQDIYTVQANLAGIPAISLPLGEHTNGLPYGVQVMAAPFREKELLGVAELLMKDRS